MVKINGICYSCEDLEYRDIIVLNYYNSRYSRTMVEKTTSSSIIDFEGLEWTEDEIDWEKSAFYGNITDPKVFAFCEYFNLDCKGFITPDKFVADNNKLFNAFCAGWNLGKCKNIL